ncbi:choice-of-anchor D domain-containing protein [Aquabacterium sp. NJ1]|uniref:choice-of-anchor D domain-containing protein n=1 Tax=Aquabacterium sp. NJ1 TaxID=1538295 RepID=UPI001376E759|nr:choice-of-anchor D domain-containing protein [Aquabacterium sp. NJ1]
MSRIDMGRAGVRSMGKTAFSLSLLALSMASATTAYAASIDNGKLLYNDDTRTFWNDSCASCHNANPARNVSFILNGANNPGAIQTAIDNNVGGMGEFKGKFTSSEVADMAAYLATCNATTRTCTTPAPAAQIAMAPASVTFASTALTTSSTAQTLTVSNAGAAPLTLTGITLAGSNPGDFTKGGTCSTATAVPAGGSCTVTVGFTPTATGTRSASLSLTSAVGNVSSTLSGTGAPAPAPSASVSTKNLSFGSIVVGASAASQSVTVSNGGTANLSFSAIATGTSEFPITGGTCTTAATVAPGASCTVGIGFKPTAAGARSGSLTITNNGSGSPLAVALSGTGIAANPVAQVSPGSLSFSQTIGVASAAQTVAVSNTGTAALTLSSINLSGAAAADYQIDPTSTCANGGTVAVNNSCNVKLVFKPSATGSRAATLNVAHNATNSPSMVALNGIGNAAPQGTLTLNQSSMTFASTAIGGTSQQAVTLGNNGAAPLTLSSMSITGANGADFVVGGDCATGASLAVGSNCTAKVTFSPAAVGTRTGTLTINTSGSSNPTATLALSGTAVAAPAPLVSVTPGQLDLGSVTVGQTSAAKALAIKNTGNAALSVSSIATTPSSFAQTNDCGASLAAGASCTVNTTFSAASAGAASGTLTIVSNAAGSPTRIGLSAQGVAVVLPVLSWQSSATGLSFADTNVGSVASTQTLVLSNAGPGNATLTQIQKSGANADDFTITGSTCANGTSLTAGASCSVGVAFQPAAAGARTASLAVLGNATGPGAIALSGTGVAPAVPAMTVAPLAINLIPAKTGLFMQPQVFTVSNTGSGQLKVTTLAASLPVMLLSRQVPEGGTCDRVPFTLNAGQSCTMKVTSLVMSSTLNSKITVVSNASATPVVVPVTSSPRPPKAACPSLLAFLSHRCD